MHIKLISARFIETEKFWPTTLTKTETWVRIFQYQQILLRLMLSMKCYCCILIMINESMVNYVLLHVLMMFISKIFMQDENKGCLDLQNLDPPLLEVLSYDANQSVYIVSIRWDLVKVYLTINVKGTRYMYIANFSMIKFWNTLLYLIITERWYKIFNSIILQK